MAKELGLQRSKSYEFWYRRKYNLTSNDPRFLDATTEEMMADYFAHTYFDDPRAAEDTVEDEDFDIENVASTIGFPVETDPGDWEPLE